ncbi:ATP-binding protein [Streptomyces cadmiisoli]|uniref:ATP-binding protein n=1 Tax=Streptomyces cadmiisoli TaxID=2184053 RepID=UPI003D70E1E5
MVMPATDARIALRGRGQELAALDRVLAMARAGNSAVLLLRGEAGIGKTALLDHAAGRATGFRTVRVAGVESEMELPFAGLHQLCAPLLNQIDRLPGPQRDALSVAFGLREGEAPNRFLVGLAVIGLLAGAAEERPLACLVDDAQWLDDGSLQVLAFVARRLLADAVALIFAVRDGDHGHRVPTGLPELIVEGLSPPDAQALLASAVRVPLDPVVRDRIVAEARGNPMVLLHLPRALAPADLAGGFWLPGGHSAAGCVEAAFHERFRSLPPDSRLLLLTAAAEPTGDADLLWRAAGEQGIPAHAAAPAESAGLVEFGTRVRFHHPLVRSAIYRRTAAPDRRAAHRALAEATDSRLDPDRRAWHRAHAAARPDEDVAADLVCSADRARGRGGAAASASFLKRAAELTPDPARRVSRALAAAQAQIDAGAVDEAHTTLAAVEANPLDDLQRARLERLRARLVFARQRGGDAPRRLLDAAHRLAPLDAALARDTLLEALGAAIFAGRLSEGPGLREIAEAARAAPPPPTPPRVVDTLLDGLTGRIVDGRTAGADGLRRALRTVREQGCGGPEADRARLWLAFRVTPEPLATELWDDDAWHELATDAVRTARAAGALAVLPTALTYLACLAVHTGDFDTAAALIDEATAISEATGGTPMMYTSLVLAAWRGREAEALDLIRTTREEVAARGEGRSLALADCATALLYNGLGRYDAALTAATRACQYEDLGLFAWGLVEQIEAAARTGRPETAAPALDVLTEHTRASGTAWALGTEACSRALLSDDDRAAEALYQEAVEHLGHCRITVRLARARLLYGEWLRRRNRRQDSRAQLRSAHETFSRIGAEGFAERARRELLATGETVRPRSTGVSGELTGQETQIARLAADGHTNAEIGAQLFISPRTVEWHLGNVFAKLGVTSRRRLRSALTRPGPGVPAG